MPYIGDGYLNIYSNDGSTSLGYYVMTISESGSNYGIVTNSGATVCAGNTLSSYAYSGNLKFLGFATEPNATEPTYAIGDKFLWAANPNVNYGEDVTNLYIVESLENTTWYVKAGWEAEAGYGTFNYNLDTSTVAQFCIGYYLKRVSGDFELTAIDNYVTNSGSYYDNSQSFTVNFDYGGTDTANPALIAWLSKWGKPMITDLTGYTVTVPMGWSADKSYGHFYVDFSYESYPSSELYIGYGLRGVATADMIAIAAQTSGGVSIIVADPSQNLTFDIISGDDVANPSLIQWLYDNNATFEKTGGEEETITILAGTYVAESLTSNTSLNQSLEFTSNGTQYSTIKYGEVSEEEFYIYYDDTKAYGLGYISGWQNQNFKTVVMDKDQTVSADFGEWFNTNFKKQETPSTPTTPHGEIYYKGNLVATIVEGETIVLHTKDFKFLGDIVIKNVGESNLIQFTIDGETYYAEQGMTWGEWLPSDYNRNHYLIVGASAGVGTYVADVLSTDLIVSGNVYYTEYLSGGGSN